MKRAILYFIFLVLCVATLKANPTEAAMDVVNRRIPNLKNRVTFILLPETSPKDIYEIEVKSGKLIIKGTSAVSMCRGLYDYLKEKCNCLMTWEGSQFNIPKILPEQPLRRVVASVPFRQHFNVVTFGYTTAFWDWKRWEYEIDWMAFHGVNMPLAMTGQEKIWEQVWKSYGLTDHDLNDFFTGPAFLAWNRLGCVYGNSDKVLEMLGESPSHRTLPKSFIEKDAKLQQKILRRERELGMKPVIPGFSGFIPRALKDKHPNLNTWEPTPWNLACRSSLALHGLDPLFNEITNKFIDTYTNYYGNASNYYLIDLFNEIDPPKTIKQKDLADIAESVYLSLQKKNKDAIWVIQGWCFYYQPYWKDKANTASFLSKIPDDKMIIIDLNADESEVFRTHPASVAKKKIIWSLLNDNWGQRTPLRGCLDKIAEKPMKALQELNQNLVGIGNSAEGIENNSICFELLYDNAWRSSCVNLNNWIKAYAEQRYQTKDIDAYRIWAKMYQLYYKDMPSGEALSYQEIPNATIGKKEVVSTEERQLIELMITASGKFGTNKLFQRDLVDVVKSYVGKNISTIIWKITNATTVKDSRLNDYRTEFDTIMLALDALIHTQQQHQLSNWITNARNFVINRDKDYLEKNARLILTTWVAPNWQGYARREWSGLVGDFYRNRWNKFFDSLNSKQFNQAEFNKSIFEWSNAWCSNTRLYPSYKCEVVKQSRYLLGLVDEFCETMNN